jgi:hypothetical protein
MRRALALTALLLTAAKPVDHPRTYLLSIVDLPVGAVTPRLTDFHIDTWGVNIKAVCRLPFGWRIDAGSYASPDGLIAGQSSVGVTWLNRSQLANEGPLLLVMLDGPIQIRTLYDKDGNGEHPATFSGKATIEDFNDDKGKIIPLTHANIHLHPARACPPLPASRLR